MTGPITIRTAQLADAQVVCEFNLRLARETEQLELDPERVLAGVSALLADPGKGIYFIAEVDGVVAGQLMITYEWSDWRNGRIWWLQSVFVREECRRSGVFRVLFDHVSALARAQPELRGLRLYMHADNVRARQTYERLGMEPTPYEVFELAFASTAGGP